MVTEPLSQMVIERIDHLADTNAHNHAETVERLTRLETQLQGLPARVTALERRNQFLAGAMAVISFVFSIILAYFKLK